jgi:hypothetical protein
MSTDFSTKCKILADVYIESKWNEELGQFKSYHDIGLPLAYFYSMELITVNDKGTKYIDETWANLCEALEVDFEGTYEDSNDILEQSPIGEDILYDEDEDL